MTRFLRNSRRGNSFATCLALVVIVFGGVGAYYFKVWQWNGLENPTADLTIVTKVSGAQLQDFRKKAVAQLCDPTKQQQSRLRELRAETKKGTKVPEDFEQDCTEVKNRLKELVGEARLKRVPKEFEKPYSQGLSSLRDTYHSLLALEEAVAASKAKDRQRLYSESVSKFRKAQQDVNACRAFFQGQE